MKKLHNHGWFSFEEITDLERRKFCAELLGRDFHHSQIEDFVEKAKNGWKFRFCEDMHSVVLMEPGNVEHPVFSTENCRTTLVGWKQ